MALIVEDGTGLATAESYISVADANAYFLARGNTTWGALSDAQCEEALRKATDFMLQRYRSLWQGYRLGSTQALDWPRVDVEVDGFGVPSDEVHVLVERACAELAYRSTVADLLPDTSSGGQVTREKVDVIEVEYLPGSNPAPTYPAIDQLLAPLLEYAPGSANRPVLRA